MQELSYEIWESQVSEEIEQMTGLGLADFAQGPFHDYYDGGDSPAIAARRIMRRELGE